MDMKLTYDVLALIAKHLPTKSRLALCMTDRTNYEMSQPSLLRDNFNKFLFLDNDRALDDIAPDCAFSYAISHHDHELLVRVIDAVDLTPQVITQEAWLGFYRMFCITFDNPTALNMLRAAVPQLNEHLAKGADQFAERINEYERDDEFLVILADAGWVTKAVPADIHTDDSLYRRMMIYRKRSGRTMRALAKAGFDPTLKIGPIGSEIDDEFNVIHWNAIKGGGDRDLLAFLMEKGVQINTLTPHRSHDTKQWMALDLASRCRQYNTMESLLALGAAPGGSLEISGRSGVLNEEGSQIFTTPLHEFLTPDSSGMGFNEIWPDNDAWYTFTLALTEEVIREENAICDHPTCFGKALFEEIVVFTVENMLQEVHALANLILKGVRLLLGTECRRYINLDIPGEGTPLSRFISLATKLRRFHHRIMTTDPEKVTGEGVKWEERPEEYGGHKCPISEYLGNENCILGPLAEAYGLLIEAGAKQDTEKGAEEITDLLRTLMVSADSSGDC